MYSRRRLTIWGLVTLGSLALSRKLSSQARPAKFTSHVYAWFPGETVRRLSPGPAESENAAMSAGPFTQADVSPDGMSATFWGGLEGWPQVWVYDFGAKIARAITMPRVASLEHSGVGLAKWLPGGNMNLFIINADGKGVSRVTQGNFQDARPVFAPDGRDLVFLSNRGGDRRGLYSVPADGHRSRDDSSVKEVSATVVLARREIHLFFVRECKRRLRSSHLAGSGHGWRERACYA